MTANKSRAADRTQLQCNRILHAAEQCFIKYGFHAASMAKISEAADMSPGLIYRYFASKSAIIKAIIERQLEIMRSDITALQGGADFISLIADLFVSWQRGKPRGMSPVLYLELIAEASRNPEIAEAADMSDGSSASGFHAWLKQLAKAQGHEPTDAEIAQSDFALRCFIDGLAMRAVRDPNLDPTLVAASLKRFLPQLLSFRSVA